MTTFRMWLENVANKKILILMRGFPGSGKSYRANLLLQKYGGNPEGHILSTDNFWISNTLERRRKGEYVSAEEEQKEYETNFNVEKLRSAHHQTHSQFKIKVDQGITPLIIDNTNIRKEYMRPFIEYAEKEGYEIRIEYPDSPWWKDVAKHLSLKPAERNQKELDSALKVLYDRQRHAMTMDVYHKMAADWDEKPSIDDIMGRTKE